jgi:hypothetical protein
MGGSWLGPVIDGRGMSHASSLHHPAPRQPRIMWSPDGAITINRDILPRALFLLVLRL